MNFRVGDKVMVKRDLEVDKDYSGYDFISDMDQYKGVITEVINKDEEGFYIIKADHGEWCWSGKMLERATKIIRQCPNCKNTKISDNANYCEACGSKLKEVKN